MGEGNGQRSGRRRGDHPSRTDRAAKRWAEGAPCLVQAVAVLVAAVGTLALLDIFVW